MPFSVIDGHGAKTKLYSAQSFTATTLATLQGNPEGIFNVTDQTTPYDYVVPATVPTTRHRSASASGIGSGSGGRGNLADTGGSPLVPVTAVVLLGVGAAVGLGMRRLRWVNR